jgi:REP element-mobilizing transposase RayT
MSDKRVLREDGIYHVYNRGNDKMDIFLEDADKLKFLQKLKQLQDNYKFDVFSYNLMTNHFHLMIKDKGITLPSIMNSLQDFYTKYFNLKYNHSGHVFGGTYRSDLVIGYKHFFDLYRYIQRNAVAAKIVKIIADYPWVSADLDHDIFNLVNFLYVEQYYKEHSKIPLEEFLSSNENDTLISKIEKQRMDDDEAMETFKSIIHEVSENILTSFSELNATLQNKVIGIAIYIGINKRQLSDFTGLSQYAIKRICLSQEFKYL